MFRFLLYFSVITFTGLSLGAQQRTQLVSVTQGDDLVEHAATTLQFVFPDFTEGNVVYHNGKTIAGKLNYNILLGEMQFVDPDSQQVFALANPNEVTMVTIGQRMFLPLNGKEFLEILTYGNIQLAVRYKGNRLSHGRQTPYGNTSPAARSSDLTGYEAGGGYMSPLEAKENIKITVTTYYYLINGKKQTLITGSKSFLKVFPKGKSDVIQEYIRQNNINFNHRGNLIALVNYCELLF